MDTNDHISKVKKREYTFINRAGNPETMQMSRREYLGIYIYAHPKNEMERAFNNEMQNKAEAIRCIRIQSFANRESAFSFPCPTPRFSLSSQRNNQ